MLTAIQALIESAIGTQSRSDDNQAQAWRLAAAALMVEVAAADFKQHPEERNAVANALLSCFQLSEQEVTQLIAEAEQNQHDAISLFEFTNVINRQCTRREKFEILINLWRIAFADGELDKYEDHRIRRIADLLHLSHSDFIQAKLRVEA